MRVIPRTLFITCFALTIAALTAGCGSSGSSSSSSSANADVSGSVSVEAVWSGDEQKHFQSVLDAFHAQYPNVTVNYKSDGDQLPTVLSTEVAGGNPPDIAVLPQPGLMKDLVAKGALQPITFAKDSITDHFSKPWVDLGTLDGTLYGLFFKGANKSTVWYNVPLFDQAGVKPPTTWDDLIAEAKTLKDSGTDAYSIGGADGWTLTDLFENIYLRQAGPDNYDKLTNHEIKWTDPTVIKALQTMAQIFSDTSNIAGGTSGALQTDFPGSVTQVYSSPPKAAMVFEGDFVGGVITDSTAAKPETDFNVFDFPSVDGSAPAVVGGGDDVVLLKDSPAAQALISYLATPEAATIWAKLGGFSSPNKDVDPSVYPDDITRATATALASAQTFRFDMSDLAPAAFGGTVGAGEWKILQDFLRNPSDVNGTAQALEAAATKAYA